MFNLTEDDILPSLGLNDSRVTTVKRETTLAATAAPVRTTAAPGRDAFNSGQLLSALKKAADVSVEPVVEDDSTLNSPETSRALGYLDPAIKSRVLKEFAGGNPSAQTLHMFHTLYNSDSSVSRAVANQIVMETNAKLQNMNQFKILLSYERKTLCVQRPGTHASREPWWNLSGPPDGRLLDYTRQETVEYLVNDMTDGQPSYRSLQILGELMSQRNNSPKQGGIFVGEHIARNLVSKANAALKESGKEHYLAISIEGAKFEVFHVKNNDYNNVTFESYDLKAFAKSR